MLTASGPKVVEFNVRFGDPEAQVILPMLDEDLPHLLMAAATGTLPSRALGFAMSGWWASSSRRRGIRSRRTRGA